MRHACTRRSAVLVAIALVTWPSMPRGAAAKDLVDTAVAAGTFQLPASSATTADEYRQPFLATGWRDVLARATEH